MNDNRDYLDPINEDEIILTLHKIDNVTNNENFKIKKVIGSGTTCVVYLASYSSGNIEHNCILKEVYPSGCGLIRSPKSRELFFRSASEDEKLKLNDNKEQYEIIKGKYIHAYKIQIDMISEENEVFTLEERRMLSIGISSPQGLYENTNGILYAVYNRDNGSVFKDYGKNENSDNENLYNITDIMIQAARIVQAFHKAGYLMLDIKESNILITGGFDHQIVMFFDFGSLIKISDLANYSFKDSTIYNSLSFTSQDKNLLLPLELQSIDYYYKQNKYSEAEETIKNILYPYGKKTDMFILASIYYNRIFNTSPTLDMVKIGEEWDLPHKSKYITIPEIIEELKKTFSKSLIKYIKKRCSIDDFIDNLCEIRTLALLERPEDREALQNPFTKISKSLLKGYSEKHWKSLSDITGKFHHLTCFKDRFECKASIEGEDKVKYTPIDIIHKDRFICLYGDGGMGKSTTLFDYWSNQLREKENSSIVCLYIDLSRYSLIRSISREDSILNGQTAENIPIELLTFIEINIIQAFGIFNNAARSGDVINDRNMSKQLSALHNLLSKKTNTPEFLIMLDGYNEILDKSDRSNLELNIAEAIKSWSNASIIVTSRLKINGFEDDIFNQMTKYRFIGIEDKEIEDSLITIKGADDYIIKELKNDKLWDVLKIPMFLNMYLSLFDQENASIHTRGELLDCYITQRELRKSKNISTSSKARDTTHSDIRSFMSIYSLPYVANLLDSSKSFYMTSEKFFACVHKAISLYLETKNLRQKFSSKYSFDEINDLNIEQILTEETGYCIYINEKEIGFSHEYFRDYFAAKHIQNILNTAKALDSPAFTNEDQLQFTKNNGLDYVWSDDVCILLGEIIGDYKNEPGYKE